MKKLLVLALVLGIASLSSAATVKLVSGGKSLVEGCAAAEVYTVDVIADFDLTGIQAIDFCGNAQIAALAAGALGEKADSGLSTQPGADGACLNRLTVNVQTGHGKFDVEDIIYSFDVTLGAISEADPGVVAPKMPGAQDVAFIPAAPFYMLGSGIVMEGVTFTPEPMTMSLLALGGLALIRRRR